MEQQALENLIHKYIAAWSEPDLAARRDLLAEVWAENGEYTDPMSHAAGRAELDSVIASFLANNPGARFSVQGEVSHHHRYVRFYWSLQFADGKEMTGMDYGEVTADGQLNKIVGFF
jgi:hypothetical protein